MRKICELFTNSLVNVAYCIDSTVKEICTNLKTVYTVQYTL